MKTMLIKSNGLLAILIIIVCIFFASSLSLADPILAQSGLDKLKVQKLHKFPSWLVLVSVPLKIIDVPEPWRNSELVVESAVYFLLPGPGEKAVGYSLGQVIKPQALKNGSFQGVIYVPINEGTGDVTGRYYTLSIAVAKRGNECKILGFGCNFDGKGCEATALMGAVDMVIPWQGSIINQF